jgi:hypothetical protein
MIQVVYYNTLLGNPTTLRGGACGILANDAGEIPKLNEDWRWQHKLCCLCFPAYYRYLSTAMDLVLDNLPTSL